MRVKEFQKKELNLKEQHSAVVAALEEKQQALKKDKESLEDQLITMEQA